MKAGFYSSLGVALLAILALLAWRLLAATLEVGLPFVVSITVALLLDPLVKRLERRGMSRSGAVGFVFGIFLLTLVLAGVIAIPILVSEAGQLQQEGPQYVANFKSYIDGFLAQHHHVGFFTLPSNFDAVFSQLSAKTSDLLRESAGSITTVLLGSITTLLQLVISLIVTFYLLLDINRLRARLFYLAPRRTRRPMALLAGDVGGVFSDYLRGLLIVSALYGVCTLALLLGLSLAHHEIAHYALIVSVAGGVLYAVPYIGPLATALITFLVAFAAGGAGFGGIAVGLTLVLNQVFDNVITPRVVGGGVGLHPVASVFALTLGGALFGLPGLLLSVPVAASIQVVLFRSFPKLTSPTPPAFLRAEGIDPEEGESAKILEGEEAKEKQSRMTAEDPPKDAEPSTTLGEPTIGDHPR